MASTHVPKANYCFQKEAFRIFIISDGLKSFYLAVLPYSFQAIIQLGQFWVFYKFLNKQKSTEVH